MEKILNKFLLPLLNKIPAKWKTATGLTAILLIAVGSASGYLDEAWTVKLEAFSLALFGVGVYHKQQSE